MNKFLISLATVFAITFGAPAANAETFLHFKEGVPFAYNVASFCKDKESIVSIIKDYEKNGMDSSIQVYQELVRSGGCATDFGSGVFIPLSLFYEYNNAIGLEVLRNGVIVYFLTSDAQFFPKGEPI